MSYDKPPKEEHGHETQTSKVAPTDTLSGRNCHFAQCVSFCWRSCRTRRGGVTRRRGVSDPMLSSSRRSPWFSHATGMAGHSDMVANYGWTSSRVSTRSTTHSAWEEYGLTAPSLRCFNVTFACKSQSSQCRSRRFCPGIVAAARVP